jgi:hypothetical protein
VAPLCENIYIKLYPYGRQYQLCDIKKQRNWGREIPGRRDTEKKKIFFFFFWRQSHYVRLKLLPRLSKCWNYRHVLLCPVNYLQVTGFQLFSSTRFLLSFVCDAGIELKALDMLGKLSTTELHLQPRLLTHSVFGFLIFFPDRIFPEGWDYKHIPPCQAWFTVFVLFFVVLGIWTQGLVLGQASTLPFEPCPQPDSLLINILALQTQMAIIPLTSFTL